VRVKHVADVTAKSLRASINAQTRRQSELHTDEALAYDHIGKEFAKHRTVNHSQDEYFKVRRCHPVGRELLRAPQARRLRHLYSISEQHLHDGFAFRWNARSARRIEDLERAAKLLRGAKGKRLTYRQPDDAAHV
jgi:hypothetical protein